MPTKGMNKTLSLVADKIQEGIEQVEGGDLYQAVTELKDALYWVGVLRKEMADMNRF